jgi:hypothetical protein
MVALTRSGRVLYAPLVENSYPAPLDDRGPAVVAASDDGGAHWGTLTSGSPDHILDVPPWMSRDPQTGRVWFASVLPDLCGAEISWSDDDGRGWQTSPVVGCPGMGSMRILEGPPPAGGARPHGYAHVVYYCARGLVLRPHRRGGEARMARAVGRVAGPLPARAADRPAARRARATAAGRHLRRAQAAYDGGDRARARAHGALGDVAGAAARNPG